MLPLLRPLRRTLVAAATALVAVAPQAAVAEKKPPLAVVLATLSDPVAADGSMFGITFQASVAHLASGTTEEFTGGPSSPRRRRPTRCASKSRPGCRTKREPLGVTIPSDRVSVVLL